MTVKAGLGYRNDTSLQPNEVAPAACSLPPALLLLIARTNQVAGRKKIYREKEREREREREREHKDFFHADNLLRCIANRTRMIVRADLFQRGEEQAI